MPAPGGEGTWEGGPSVGLSRLSVGLRVLVVCAPELSSSTAGQLSPRCGHQSSLHSVCRTNFAMSFRTLKRWLRKFMWAVVLPPAVLTDVVFELLLRVDARVRLAERAVTVSLFGFFAAGWLMTLGEGIFRATAFSLEWAVVRLIILCGQMQGELASMCASMLTNGENSVSYTRLLVEHVRLNMPAVKFEVVLGLGAYRALTCIVQGACALGWGCVVLCVSIWHVTVQWPYVCCWIIVSLILCFNLD